MKHLLFVAIAASALLFTACTPEKSTPENAAQKYTKEQLVLPQAMKADTSGLTFTLVETAENTATVEIGGVIAVTGKVKAVKNAKGQWEIQ